MYCFKGVWVFVLMVCGCVCVCVCFKNVCVGVLLPLYANRGTIPHVLYNNTRRYYDATDMIWCVVSILNVAFIIHIINFIFVNINLNNNKNLYF